MKNENGQRVVLNVMWKGLDGKGGGEVDVDFTDKTVFDVKAAGDLRMSAKILPLPKTDYEKMQLDRLKLIDAARNGLLPTFPVEVDSQSVFIHNRIVRLTDGLVAPHESLTLGVFACVPVLIAGFEVAKECAESFDLDNLTAGRMQQSSPGVHLRQGLQGRAARRAHRSRRWDPTHRRRHQQEQQARPLPGYLHLRGPHPAPAGAGRTGKDLG
jgi:hypothetical protein